MIGIYKITNLINQKCYIGQSTNIQKRWTAHRSAAHNPHNRAHYSSHLYRAMRKYGIENFRFEILEECSVSLLNQKEREYIQKYNSCFAGYNESLGGDCSCHSPKEIVLKIIYDLESTTLTQKEIANKHHVTEKLVQSINTGHAWVHDRLYPIRQHTYTKPEPKVCNDCGTLISKNSQRCVQCEQKKRQMLAVQKKPTKEQLYDALMQHHRFSTVARLYNISPTQLKRWCREFNIPDSAAAYHVIRPVFMCDISTGQILQKFDTARSAEKYFCKSTGAIQRALNGQRLSAYGYKWIYADTNTQ